MSRCGSSYSRLAVSPDQSKWIYSHQFGSCHSHWGSHFNSGSCFLFFLERCECCHRYDFVCLFPQGSYNIFQNAYVLKFIFSNFVKEKKKTMSWLFCDWLKHLVGSQSDYKLAYIKVTVSYWRHFSALGVTCNYLNFLCFMIESLGY